jgi:hypothetical protein
MDDAIGENVGDVGDIGFFPTKSYDCCFFFPTSSWREQALNGANNT